MVRLNFVILLLGVFPLFLLLGLFFLVRGLWGRPALSEPHCAKCGYDLRGIAFAGPWKCAECGADLEKPRAVRFGRCPRRTWMITTGAVMLVLPVLLAVPLLFGLRSVAGGGPRAGQSNAALVASLATTANTPWEWRELETRYRAGTLSQAEAAQAIDQLIAHLDKQPQKASHLSWSGEFVKLVDAGGAINDEQLARFTDAFYGKEVTVRMPARARQGQAVTFSLDYSGHSNIPGLKLLVALRRMTLDGREVKPLSHYGGKQDDPDSLSDTGINGIGGEFRTDALPGRYELVFELEMGLADETAALRNSHRPGQPNRWPATRRAWSKTVKAPLVIVGPDEEVIEKVTDPALDPLATRQVRVRSLVYSPRLSRVTLTLTGERDKPVPLRYEPLLRYGGKETRLTGHESRQDGSGRSDTHIAEIADLPEGVRTADVILRPNIASAEREPGLERVWAKEVVFEGVTIEREGAATPVE